MGQEHSSRNKLAAAAGLLVANLVVAVAMSTSMAGAQVAPEPCDGDPICRCYHSGTQGSYCSSTNQNPASPICVDEPC